MDNQPSSSPAPWLATIPILQSDPELAAEYEAILHANRLGRLEILDIAAKLWLQACHPNSSGEEFPIQALEELRPNIPSNLPVNQPLPQEDAAGPGGPAASGG